MLDRTTSWTRAGQLSLAGSGALCVVLTALWMLLPSTLSVRIETTPSGAQVVHESQVIGTTPVLLKLRAVRTELTLQLDGYETGTTIVDPALSKSSVAVELLPAPLTYAVNVHPSEATITVVGGGATLNGNGERRTLTVARPDPRQEITLIGKLQGFPDIQQVVSPVPGKPERLEIRFPARILFDLPRLGIPLSVRLNDNDVLAGATQLLVPPNTNGQRLRFLVGWIPFADRPLPRLVPGEKIHLTVPAPVAIYKVGRLPMGISLAATGSAGVVADKDGKHWIVVSSIGKPEAATVSFIAGETTLTTLQLSQLEQSKGPATEWSIHEVVGASSDTALTIQGKGHLVRHPDGRAWLFVPRSDGKQWVKVTALRPGFKEIARLLTPAEGERSVLLLEPALLSPLFEHAIPENMPILVNISNYGSFKRRLQELRGVQLCQTPMMQPFVSRFLEKSEQSVGRIRNEFGIDVVNLCAAHTGQILLAWRPYQPARPAGFTLAPTFPTLALVPTPAVRGKPPVGVFLSDVPGNSAPIQAMLDDMQRAGTIGDRFLSVTKSDVLVGATDAGSAQLVIERLHQNRDAPFVLNPRLKTFRERAGGTGDFECFVDLKQWYRSNLAGSIESAGVSFSIAQGPFDTLTHFLVITNGASAFFIKYLAMPPQSLVPEPWVPADVTGYCSLTWDHSEADAILRILFPQLSKIVPLLGDRLTLVTDLTDSRGFLVPRVLLAWKLKHPPDINAPIEGLRELLLWLTSSKATLVKLGGETGRTIYCLNYGKWLERQINSDVPVPIGKVAIVATDTHLMLATHLELLEKVLNHKGAGLADNPNYRRVAAHFPQQCSAVAYQAPEQYQLLLQALKTGRVPDLMQEIPGLPELLGGLVDALDGRQLPDYDKLKEYLAPSGGYGVMSDKGFHFTHFMLNR